MVAGAGDAPGTGFPAIGPAVPSVVRAVPASVWDDDFGLDAETCLLVRPDQHIAFRGRPDDAVAALSRLFGSAPG